MELATTPKLAAAETVNADEEMRSFEEAVERYEKDVIDP